MSTTLISFLGKSQLDPSTGYRTALYQIADGVQRRVPFMGMALAEHLKPQRLVLFGTAGSMWDVFFEREAEERVLDQAEQWQALSDAVRADAVTQDMLQGYAEHLSRRLGMTVVCRLISPARTEAEQAQLLLDLADVVPKGETIDLDVTHSFRHLPMLALVAARYLGRLKNVTVRDIYYGALEMSTGGVTPVVRLGGLLRMLDGVEAMACYDKDGDYGVFADLLRQDGLPPKRAELLREAAYLERLQHAEEARERLRSVMPALEAHQSPFMRLFRPQLLERLSWFRQKTRHERELQLADEHLERRDYLRGAMLLQEAYLSRETIGTAKNATDYAVREDCRKTAQATDGAMRELFYLRNGMAHTVTPSNLQVAETLRTEPTLRGRLLALREQIFGRRVPEKVMYGAMSKASASCQRPSRNTRP